MSAGGEVGGEVADRDCGLALGTPVIIDGIVVGRSEFSDGPPSYLVEFNRKSKTVREWFLGDDLDTDSADGGGI